MALGGSGLDGESPAGNGARVIAVVGSQRQTRTPDGGTAMVMSVGPVLFGFATTATSVDSLIVEWPSGLVTTQTGVATDQLFDSHRADELYALTGRGGQHAELARARRGATTTGTAWRLDLHVANYGQVDSLYRNDAGVMTPVAALTTMTTGCVE